MKKYKLGGGCHNEAGVSYVKGDIVESKNPLDKMFPDRFECCSGKTTETDEEASGEGEGTSGLGELVTDQFAEETDTSGVVIYEKAGWYKVYDEEDTTEPLNDKGLRKEDVAAFVEDLESSE